MNFILLNSFLSIYAVQKCKTMPPSPKRRRKSGSNVFVKSWLRESKFKTWLQEGQDGSAHCKLCSTTLRPKHDALIEHSKTNEHIKALSDFKCCENVKPLTSLGITSDRAANNTIKTAELKLAVFIAEHCSMNTVDHMGELLKTLSPNDDTMTKIRVKCGPKCVIRTKPFMFCTTSYVCVSQVHLAPITNIFMPNNWIFAVNFGIHLSCNIYILRVNIMLNKMM